MINNKTFLAVVIAVVVFASSIVSAEVLNFRGLQLGASEQEIRTTEKATLLHEAGAGGTKMLVYNAQFAGEDATLLYRLAGNQFYQAQYIFEDKGRGCSGLNAKLDDVVKELTGAYGAPTTPRAEQAKCNKEISWQLPGGSIIARLTTSSKNTDLEVVFASAGN